MISVAIDGPAGAGKSTLARRLAADFGYIYVDTGAMFRTIGLYALRAGKDPKDNEAVNALLPNITLEFAFIEGEQHIYLNGEDVSTAIRTEEVGMAASAVGANPAVRAFLLEMQRDMARTQNILMDGRDIGTVVLPNATVKIFLTASPEARATRRWKEYQQKGIDTPYEDVLADVKRGDIGSTAAAYARMLTGVGEHDPWNIDAVTVNPYLGTDGITPFVDAAAQTDKDLFVLVRTSNPSSSELQMLDLANGKKVYEHVADLVEGWGAETIGKHGYSRVGAVVGATHPEEGKALRKRMPHTFFLVPHFLDAAHILKSRFTGAAESGCEQILLGFVFVEGLIDFPFQRFLVFPAGAFLLVEGIVDGVVEAVDGDNAGVGNSGFLLSWAQVA